VIKIRYSDLPGGLHVRVGVHGRNTILYLLPGLTAAQRKAAIRRARSAARVGHGPGLPAPGVARALAADRIRTTVRNGLAAMRMHPAIFLPPLIIIVAVAAAYLLLVSVSVRFNPGHASERNVPVDINRSSRAARAGRSSSPGDPPPGGMSPGRQRSPSPTAHPGPGPGRAASPHPASSLSAAPSPSPSRSSTRAPSPGPSGSAPAAPGPGPSSVMSPSPSGSPGPGSGSGGGDVCVKVGPFGMCIGL
jgi:hypothetical protein